MLEAQFLTDDHKNAVISFLPKAVDLRDICAIITWLISFLGPSNDRPLELIQSDAAIASRMSSI